MWLVVPWEEYEAKWTKGQIHKSSHLGAWIQRVFGKIDAHNQPILQLPPDDSPLENDVPLGVEESSTFGDKGSQNTDWENPVWWDWHRKIRHEEWALDTWKQLREQLPGDELYKSSYKEIAELVQLTQAQSAEISEMVDSDAEE
jgi:hypothetical protein